MAKVFFQGNESQTSGSLPKVGDTLPDAVLVAGDLSEKKLTDYEGKRLVLNVFPSLDTDVCAKSVRAFNELAGSAENLSLIHISEPTRQVR